MSSVKTIRSLTRGLRVLRIMETMDAASLQELSLRTDLSKPTVMRILRTLEEAGYIRRGISDQLYRLTIRSRPARVHAAHSRLVDVAAPALDRLCRDVLWPSDLAICDDGSMWIQETTRRLSPFMMNRDVISHRIHILQSAMGRAYLAYCEEDVRAGILNRLQASSDPHDRMARKRDVIDKLLDEVLDNGFATRAAGYFITRATEAKVNAIAIPVLHQQAAIASINLIWVSRAASAVKFANEHLPRLTQAAREIEQAYAAKVRGRP